MKNTGRNTPRQRQRGDSDGGMLIIAILLMMFLFIGEPDAWDKLHAYVMSLQPIEAAK